MRAVEYRGSGAFGVADRRPVMPGKDDVVVAPEYVGLCGTDLHIYHGRMDERVGRGRVLGHEVAGRIASVGTGVRGWEKGDPVTVMPVRSCGQCGACASGFSNVCPYLEFLGIDSDGGLQEQWVVPAGLLVRLPAGMELRVGALIEPLAVAVHDVRRARVSTGEKVAVIGAGPIGLLMGLVARARGAEVLLVEPNPYRRAIALQQGFAVFGASQVDHELRDTIIASTAGEGPGVVFEVSGSPEGMELAVEVAAVGARICLVAIHSDRRSVDLHRFFWRELALVGARLYGRADFEAAVELVTTSAIEPSALISAITPLDRVGGALEQLAAGGAMMKVLVHCQSER